MCIRDRGNCKLTSRSQTAIVVLMFGAAVLWRSVHQPVVATSTSEAEYMALSDAARELLYLHGFTDELGIAELKFKLPLTVHTDNDGAYKMAHEGADTTRTRHMHRRWHFVRELVREEYHGTDKPLLAIRLIAGTTNWADGLTKGLAKTLNKVSNARMGLYNIN